MYNQACNLSITYTLLPLLERDMILIVRWNTPMTVCVTVIWTPTITTLDVILIQKYAPFECAIAHCSTRWHFFFEQILFSQSVYILSESAREIFRSVYTLIAWYRILSLARQRIKSVVHSTGGSSRQSHEKWVGSKKSEALKLSVFRMESQETFLVQEINTKMRNIEVVEALMDNDINELSKLWEEMASNQRLLARRAGPKKWHLPPLNAQCGRCSKKFWMYPRTVLGETASAVRNGYVDHVYACIWLRASTKSLYCILINISVKHTIR